MRAKSYLSAIIQTISINQIYPTMKKFLILPLLLISFGIFAQDALPDASVSTLDGKTGSIKSFVNPEKITILSFWATWCHPCQEELTNMSKLYAEWQTEYNVEIIAVTIDNARALGKVPGIVKTKGWEYTILSDKNEDLKRALNIQDIPFSFLIKDGKIISSHSGYTAGAEFELEEEIKKLAGK